MENEKQNCKGMDTQNHQIDEKRYLANICLFYKKLLTKQRNSWFSIVIIILLSAFVFSGFSKDNAMPATSFEALSSSIFAEIEENNEDNLLINNLLTDNQLTYNNQSSTGLPTNTTSKQDAQTAKSLNGTISTTQSLINY